MVKDLVEISDFARLSHEVQQYIALEHFDFGYGFYETSLAFQDFQSQET